MFSARLNENLLWRPAAPQEIDLASLGWSEAIGPAQFRCHTTELSPMAEQHTDAAQGQQRSAHRLGDRVDRTIDAVLYH